MYHPEVVNRRIERALQLGLLAAPPTYHTFAEAQSTVRHLNSIYDAETHSWTRELFPDEIAFIRNERTLCKFDFTYWYTRYVYIKDRTDRIVKFNPWVSQLILHDMFAENELDGIGIELQSLKARQLGNSRFISLAQLHRLQFYANINAVLASSSTDKTGKLADMMMISIDNQPHWLVPEYAGGPRDGARRSGGEWFEFANKSSVTLQAGSQVTGIARGTTPTVIHISELAEFLNPEESIDSSLFRAVHPSARVLLVLESTALGMKNWWHNTWLNSKTGWPERRSRLRPIFLPWYVGSPQLGYVYPEPGFLDRSPVPPDYTPALWVLEHARKAEEYVKTVDYLRRYMGENWHMPIEQIWFYEVERQQAMNKGQLNKFFSEMPSTDSEAFQSTNISIFTTETITAHSDAIRIPKAVYGLYGPDMSQRTVLFHKTQINPDLPIIDIHYEWGANPRHYQLVPLKWNGYLTDDGLDKIYVWEYPEDGQIYSIGSDTAQGVSQDRSTLEVFRKGSIHQLGAQCAEFASDKLNALDLTPYIAGLGAFYSVRDPSYDNFRKQCRLAIECKSSGDLAQLGMRMDGWSNFHPWTSHRIDSRELDPAKYNRIGIFTNQAFRISIQEFLMKMLRDMEIRVFSPYLIDEMRTLEGDYATQSFKAMYGAHDDRIMSLGFSIITLYQYELNRQVAAKPTDQALEEVRQTGKILQKRYASWQPSEQERPN